MSLDEMPWISMAEKAAARNATTTLARDGNRLSTAKKAAKAVKPHEQAMKDPSGGGSTLHVMLERREHGREDRDCPGHWTSRDFRHRCIASRGPFWPAWLFEHPRSGEPRRELGLSSREAQADCVSATTGRGGRDPSRVSCAAVPPGGAGGFPHRTVTCRSIGPAE